MIFHSAIHIAWAWKLSGRESCQFFSHERELILKKLFCQVIKFYCSTLRRKGEPGTSSSPHLILIYRRWEVLHITHYTLHITHRLQHTTRVSGVSPVEARALRRPELVRQTPGNPTRPGYLCHMSCPSCSLSCMQHDWDEMWRNKTIYKSLANWNFCLP